MSSKPPDWLTSYQWQAPFYAKGSGNALEINLISRDADSIARTTALKTPAQVTFQEQVASRNRCKEPKTSNSKRCRL